MEHLGGCSLQEQQFVVHAAPAVQAAAQLAVAPVGVQHLQQLLADLLQLLHAGAQHGRGLGGGKRGWGGLGGWENPGV